MTTYRANFVYIFFLITHENFVTKGTYNILCNTSPAKSPFTTIKCIKNLTSEVSNELALKRAKRENHFNRNSATKSATMKSLRTV